MMIARLNLNANNRHPKDVIGGEQEDLFARSIAVTPKMEEPLQKFVLQDIKKSVLDVIIKNDNNEEFAATVKKFWPQIEVHSIFYMIGFIEKKFEVKKTSLLLPNVKYKETSIEEQKNSWMRSFEEEESDVGRIMQMGPLKVVHQINSNQW
ncbi:hypothetical protein QJS10_CPB14g00956 [Acorus calamus]|uniref:Uncharacterized protein n=1 Tax=Acorus calamus TaxID=4465 RepID=A0AAV9DB96_ACOCL|nr:hypothetical protein QJS10_CPB14g00956 [Acorus calamus]